MANFTSVTLNGDQSETSNSKPAGEGRQVSRGMLNDMGSTQPQNMRVTSGPDGMTAETLKVQTAEGPKTSGLPGSLSTIQNSYGNPVGDMSAINPKTDSIQVGSSRCTIETAIQQGLLSRDGDGNLIESEALKSINEKHVRSLGENTKVDLIPADHRAVLNKFHERVGASATSAFIAQAAMAAVNGQGVDKLIEDFSQAAGAKSDTVHRWVTEYMNYLLDAGTKLAAHLGDIDEDKLTDFVGKLSKSKQGRLLMAMHYGDHSALKWLTRAYKLGYTG